MSIHARLKTRLKMKPNDPNSPYPKIKTTQADLDKIDKILLKEIKNLEKECRRHWVSREEYSSVRSKLVSAEDRLRTAKGIFKELEESWNQDPVLKTRLEDKLGKILLVSAKKEGETKQ